MYFISGVSGVGKTSVMEILKKDLAATYVVKDFDERGVPAGGGRPWRLAETEHWIKAGVRLAEDGQVLIVCGLANPEEIARMPDAESVSIILLDAPGVVIIERLNRRNENTTVKAGLENAVGSVDAFIAGSRDFAPVLRSICIAAGIPVIDTASRAPDEVAAEVKKLL